MRSINLPWQRLLSFARLVGGWIFVVGSCLGDWSAAQATMTIDFTDEKTGEPIPCRVELRDAKGRALKTRDALNHLPWTIVNGQMIYRGRAGDYKFDVFHGPEHSSGGGGFTLDKKGEGGDVVRLPRHANMAEEKYFGGDLLACLPSEELPAWLPAEGLTMAAVVRRASQPRPAAEPKPDTTNKDATNKDKTKKDTDNKDTDKKDTAHKVPGVRSSTDGRWYSDDSYFDDRPGSGLIFHGWQPPAEVPEHVSSSRLLEMARQAPEVHVEIARLWARDAPVWLASGKVDAIQILSEHATRDGKTDVKLSDMYHPEPAKYKGARGPGRLVENLYWQVLEAGLRIPPSAGSGVGSSTSPLGYNRVYVNIPGTLQNSELWWDALCKGRSFVTNGPLLRAKINDQLPGHVFRAAGSVLKLNVALELTVADPVEYVDVVFNGEALYHARLDEYARQGGKIPALELKESGWIIVRVVTSRDETYRLASTAPFYVEFDKSRVSKAACQMFADWLEQTVAQQKSPDKYQRAALDFWKARIEASTAP